MIVKLKYLLKHSSIYTIATILQKLTGFLTLTFLTDTALVSIMEFSAYQYFIRITLVLSAIFSLGMEGAIIRMIKLNEDRKKEIISSATNVLLLSVVTASIIIFFSRDLIATYLLVDSTMIELAGLMGFVVAFDIMSNLPQHYFRASERPALFTVIRIVRFVLEFFGIYFGLVYLDYGILGAGIGLVTAAFVQLLFMLPFYRHFYQLGYNREIIKEMLFFGLPLVPNTILYLLIEMSDTYIIEYFVNKETQATYTNIYKFGAILTIINSSFRAAFQPIMLREAKADNKAYFRIVLKYFVIFSSFIMILTSLLAVDTIRYNPIDLIRNLIRDPIYYTQSHVLSLILMGYIFLGIYYNFSISYYFKNKSFLLLRLTFVGLVVNVSINLMIGFFPEKATIIAAFATMMAFFTMALLSYVKSQKIFPIDYEINKIGQIIIYPIMIIILTLNNFIDNYFLKVLIGFGFIPYLFIIKILNMNELMNTIKSLKK